jgi:NitT/TauT family transport system permease protein
VTDAQATPETIPLIERPTKFNFHRVLMPNEATDRKVGFLLSLGWIALLLVVWFTAPLALFPSPGEVLDGFLKQWHAGSAFQMARSIEVSLLAIVLSAVIGLSLAYLSTIPLFRPPVAALGQLRFLSLAGMILFFLLATPNAFWLKVSVLTYAISTFFVNDMVRVVDSIPSERFDHARTLGFSRWKVLREVVIRGTLPEAFDSLRINAAMAWMMLTMVEGLSRSEGGIGVLLLNLDRFRNLGALFGVQFMIFVVGILQDLLIRCIKADVCPYTVTEGTQLTFGIVRWLKALGGSQVAR